MIHVSGKVPHLVCQRTNDTNARSGSPNIRTVPQPSMPGKLLLIPYPLYINPLCIHCALGSTSLGISNKLVHLCKQFIRVICVRAGAVSRLHKILVNFRHSAAAAAAAVRHQAMCRCMLRIVSVGIPTNTVGYAARQ